MRDPEAAADTRDMYMVHTMFRREFAALPGLVRDVPEGDAERRATVAEHVEFLAGVLEGHHRAEDALMWPKLLERGSAEVGPAVETMETQHGRLDQLSSSLVAALGRWRDDPAEVAAVLDELVGALYQHMGMEETVILPLAEKYMTAGEWTEMAHHSGAGMPAGKLTLIFGMTAYEADPAVMAETLGSLPPDVRAELENEGVRAYASYAERIHGTATPRRSGPLGL
ncbi:hemerythrin domain-containing protein [Actinoplanes sp. TBRC 11911]|uniref:hemerythrin domain-containing protein n=1 Tax=Actinoplanes sp. TBRC 11911 TaxID=2729386 RepID=UPI00145CC369|nr:hemerythrin domain-containing protein [Actinoplanes sp. TBRC 11911]NMO55692.1 hemerythrin domain-containing protein [Actinoplanes sp. TBRC 11911]